MVTAAPKAAELRHAPQIWLALATVAALVPFLNKAFHIDDPLFLWMAQQITRHPFAPYSFQVNWSSYFRPMWEEMQNPPLCSYYLAAAMRLLGMAEVFLHAAFVLWAVLAVIGVYHLARRFCPDPFFAGLLTLFTPVFLVSATNVMCDIMLLALFVWTVEFWLNGCATKRTWPLAVAALLSGGAFFTKYFGIALVPLLLAYSLWSDRGFRPRVLFLLFPVCVAVGYELFTRAIFGHGLFLGAGNMAYGAWHESHLPFFSQGIVGLCFVGGCLLSVSFVLCGRSLVVWAGAVIVGFFLFRFLVPINPAWELGSNTLAVQLEGGLFAGLGLALLFLAFADFRRWRNALSLLLLLWVAGTFLFVTFLNWSITARTVLPLAPPAVFLFLRVPGSIGRSQKVVALAVASVLSLTVTASDVSVANSSRAAARAFHDRFASETATVWFQSHWGFQYYMQQWRARPIDVRNFHFKSGDVIIAPANNTAIRQIDLAEVFRPEALEFPLLPLVTTFAHGSGACFYSSARGPLPWAIGHVSPEKFYAARFR